ncbi:MAG: hypothetical protein AB1511_09950 [Deinococcota bacterium]
MPQPVLPALVRKAFLPGEDTPGMGWMLAGLGDVRAVTFVLALRRWGFGASGNGLPGQRLRQVTSSQAVRRGFLHTLARRSVQVCA